VKSAPAENTAPKAVLDDAELLAGMQRGDGDSAEALYDRLRPRVESTVRRLLGRADPDHDDCVQNTFVELVKSVDGYRGECSLEHWVAQIAARVVYRQIRQRKLQRRYFDTGSEAPDRPEPIDPSRRLMARDLFERIRSMLGAIETDNTYTFMLHDVVGFDLREIAQITGVSVAAAQQRLIRGRRAVHAHLSTDDAALARDLEEWKS
jgi:RNA polymerase sigma-70 factor (ECF subfamily)